MITSVGQLSGDADGGREWPICSGSQSNSTITPNMGNGTAISGRPPDIEGVLRQLMSGTSVVNEHRRTGQRSRKPG